MANRSTFSRALPRNLGRLVTQSNNPEYKKVQLVPAIDPKTGAVRLNGDGKPFNVKQVLPDYDRMLRQLFINAHAHHKAFKLKRLAKEVAAEVSKDAEVADAA